MPIRTADVYAAPIDADLDYLCTLIRFVDRNPLGVASSSASGLLHRPMFDGIGGLLVYLLWRWAACARCVGGAISLVLTAATDPDGHR